MTVKELKEKISNLPDDMEVYVSCEGYTNYLDTDNETRITVDNSKLFISDACIFD